MPTKTEEQKGKDAVARIRANIEVDEESGCWMWRGYVVTTGYGVFALNDKKYLVHRFIYKAVVGQIPDRLVLDHLCGVKLCVNPHHLEPVTLSENFRRACATSTNSKRIAGRLSDFPIESVPAFNACLEEEGNCWIFRGYRSSSSSYGMFVLNGFRFPPHRLSYELSFGPISEGLVVDHICHNTLCCRPSHLRLTTPSENVRSRYESLRNSDSDGDAVRSEYRRVSVEPYHIFSDPQEFLDMLPTERERERFGSRIEVVGDCWLWTSTVAGRSRVPVFSVIGVTCVAARYSYEWALGLIPEGKVLWSICDNSRCIRPEHYIPIVRSEALRKNAMRRKELAT